MTNPTLKDLLRNALEGGAPELPELLGIMKDIDPKAAERVAFTNILPDAMASVRKTLTQMLELLLLTSLDEECPGDESHPAHTIPGENFARGALALECLDVLREVIADDHAVLAAIKRSFTLRQPEDATVEVVETHTPRSCASREVH